MHILPLPQACIEYVFSFSVYLISNQFLMIWKPLHLSIREAKINKTSVCLGLEELTNLWKHTHTHTHTHCKEVLFCLMRIMYVPAHTGHLYDSCQGSYAASEDNMWFPPVDWVWVGDADQVSFPVPLPLSWRWWRSKLPLWSLNIFQVLSLS